MSNLKIIIDIKNKNDICTNSIKINKQNVTDFITLKEVIANALKNQYDYSSNNIKERLSLLNEIKDATSTEAIMEAFSKTKSYEIKEFKWQEIK